MRERYLGKEIKVANIKVATRLSGKIEAAKKPHLDQVCSACATVSVCGYAGICIIRDFRFSFPLFYDMIFVHFEPERKRS